MATPEDIKTVDPNAVYQDIRNYMQMLIYLADFEELRIIQSLKDFSNCDKGALVRSLWVNHGEEDKRVIQLICNVCLDYEIYDKMLWGQCLAQLQGDSGSYRYLLGILEFISSIPEFSLLDGIADIWNDVLLKSLLDISDLRQEKVLFEQILLLIQKCPFLEDLDRVEFVKYFGQLSQNGHKIDALRGLAVFSRDETTLGSVETILESFSDDELISLLDLMYPDRKTSDWIFDICVSRDMIPESIFNLILERERFDQIIPSRHAPKFALFAIHHDKIEGLLKAVLSGDRRKVAEDLVVQYTRHWFSESSSSMPDPDLSTPGQLLQVLLMITSRCPYPGCLFLCPVFPSFSLNHFIFKDFVSMDVLRFCLGRM
ncbi:MAG: hypothetical protein SGCHY_001895 [Lobulomycetales sp.]